MIPINPNKKLCFTILSETDENGDALPVDAGLGYAFYGDATVETNNLSSDRNKPVSQDCVISYSGGFISEDYHASSIRTKTPLVRLTFESCNARYWLSTENLADHISMGQYLNSAQVAQVLNWISFCLALPPVRKY